MFVSPIIERELRVALRKHKAVSSRFYAAAAAGAVVLFFLMLGSLGAMRQFGKELHYILLIFGLYMAVVVPIKISVGLFSEERRNQTMELLYLAGVGPGELFSGKLLAGALVASGNLLALAPFLAVPFLCGGISLDLFLATIACFPVLLFFVVSVGVLASVLCTDDGSAFIGAIVVGAILCLGVAIPYWMGTAIGGTPPFAAKWLCLGPGYGPYLVGHNFAGQRPGVFWTACGTTAAWGVLCLGLAAAMLRRTWRKELERSTMAGWRAKFESRVYGTQTWREQLRKKLLGINAFQWLVEQDRRPVAVLWSIIGSVCLVWLLGWWAWPRVWPSTTNFFVTAMLLIIIVELAMTYTAARRIGNDRRDGVLELLLTTPLLPEEIADGQFAASKRLFRPVRATLFGLCVLMAWAGLLTRSWTTEALISYGLIWALLLLWCARSLRQSTPRAMWIGINTGRPAYAIFRLQGGWWWIWMVYNMRNMGRIFRGSTVNFPSGSFGEVVFIAIAFLAVLCFGVVNLMSGNKMRQKLITEMRSVAREPVPDPRDPRFKKWKTTERLPRSAYVEMAEMVGAYPQRMKDREREKKARA